MYTTAATAGVSYGAGFQLTAGNDIADKTEAQCKTVCDAVSMGLKRSIGVYWGSTGVYCGSIGGLLCLLGIYWVYWGSIGSTGCLLGLLGVYWVCWESTGVYLGLLGVFWGLIV